MAPNGPSRHQDKTILPQGGEDRFLFQPGAVIGHRYRVEGPIGKGGVGEVYKATHIGQGREFALKFVAASASGAEEIARRAEAIQGLSGQMQRCFAPIDVLRAEGGWWIATSFAPCGSLDTCLKRSLRAGHALPWSDAKPILLGVAHALAELHDREDPLVHRDLKPSNILLLSWPCRDAEDVRLTDFDLARSELVAKQAGNATLMHAGSGSYMSPEQESGRDPHPSMDIYSFGVLAYELLTGERPRPESARFAEILESRLLHAKALANCLDLNPKNRPPAKDLVHAIQQIQERSTRVSDRLEDLELERKARAGHTQSQYEYALVLRENGADGLAADFLRRAAKKDHADAAWELFKLTESDGDLQWAARLGHSGAIQEARRRADEEQRRASTARAMEGLSLREKAKALLESDSAAARALLERAADLGDPEAMVLLASLLEPTAPARAAELRRLASDHGYEGPEVALDDIAKARDFEESGNLEMALDYVELAFTKGSRDPELILDLGRRLIVFGYFDDADRLLKRFADGYITPAERKRAAQMLVASARLRYWRDKAIIALTACFATACFIQHWSEYWPLGPTVVFVGLWLLTLGVAALEKGFMRKRGREVDALTLRQWFGGRRWWDNIKRTFASRPRLRSK
jgi:serine/threonine protein kinase